MQDKGGNSVFVCLCVCLFVCALLAEHMLCCCWYCIFLYRINLLSFAVITDK